MNTQTLKSQLKLLRLPTASEELEEVLALSQEAVSLHWASELMQREIDARKQRSVQRRIQQASFPEQTSLEAFDWDFNPEISQDKILALASLKFIQENQIVLFLGPPGTGKTHVATALGIKAAQQGHRVYCTSAKKLCSQIKMAKLKNQLDNLFRKILSSHLWIIDDWGVVSMEREIAEEVFDLLDRRKQSSAMILTSNRDIQEWAEVFPDLVLANATIDRIFDRSQNFLFKGKSYRLKGKIKLPETMELK